MLQQFMIVYNLSIWYLIIYLSRYLDQETEKEPSRSSSQAATCYNQSNHSKVEAIPLSTLPIKDTTSDLSICSQHYPFNAEHQVVTL